MKFRQLIILAVTSVMACMVSAQTVRETIRLDEGWKFAFGNASDPAKDFGCGTEYFNYLTKANSLHNEGPYSQKFDDSAWEEVQDSKGRIVPDACPILTFRIEGEGRILGVGNGDPSYLGADHPKDKDCREFSIPAFNGLAQVIIQSTKTAGSLQLTAISDGLKESILTLKAQ